MSDARIHLLGVDVETGQTRSVERSDLEKVAADWYRGAGRSVRVGVQPEDLSQAGWGVVFPAGSDLRVREALAPLLALRRCQAGELFRELTYFPGDGVSLFRNRLREGFGPVNPEKIPYYLLLVGDAEQIPHGFQAGLDIPYAVGRLALQSVEAYGRYAASVCAFEENGACRESKLAIFSPTHPGDKASEVCAARLASPMMSYFGQRSGGQLAATAIRDQATRNAFLGMLANPAASLILAAGHGTMYKSGHPLQRQLQGALVCADWKKNGPMRMEHIIEPSILAPEHDLAGRIFFIFGCFTAGTPHLNSFDPSPRDQRGRLAEAAFVAHLPQALLERGALAVIAHVDQAFPIAFQWEHFGQLELFQATLAALLDGHRVGYALEGFAERYSQIAQVVLELKTEMGDEDPGDFDSLLLWTAYHDARGLVVLGDPAVRLGS